MRAEQELKHDHAPGFFLVCSRTGTRSDTKPYFVLFSDDIWLFAVRPINLDQLGDLKTARVRRDSPFDKPDLQLGLSVTAFNESRELSWKAGI